MTTAAHVAVVGGGWAGFAAAITLAQGGCQVSLHEAAREPGGRARNLPCAEGDGTTVVDNGQHILIGAYTQCLRLMQEVGVNTDEALLRHPMALRYADGSGLQLPEWPAPLDALAGIATASGWGAGERMALLARAVRWRMQRFRCADTATVANICQGLPQRLMDEFIEPLCVSALNLPAASASASVFLRVLQDALFAGTGGSHFLVPRLGLGDLLVQPAQRWLQAQGHTVQLGSRVQNLVLQGSQWLLQTADSAPAVSGGAPTPQTPHTPRYDAVILACPPQEAARLCLNAAEDESMSAHDSIALANWSALAQQLQHTAIATVYARVSQPAQRLPQDLPWLALRCGPQRPAQFVFDRGHLSGQPQDQGLMAFVISDCQLGRAPLQAQVLQQAANELGWTEMQPVQTVVEKRATFACTPALQRPGMELSEQLWACGDYIDGPYPATLEGAVRSGIAAAQAAIAALRQ